MFVFSNVSLCIIKFNNDYKWYICSVWFVDIRICDQANKNGPYWHKQTPNQMMLNLFELPYVGKFQSGKKLGNLANRMLFINFTHQLLLL